MALIWILFFILTQWSIIRFFQVATRNEKFMVDSVSQQVQFRRHLSHSRKIRRDLKPYMKSGMGEDF